MTLPSFLTLRRILAIDAISSGGMGALLVAGADLLEPWLGLPVGFQRVAGALLLPYAAMVAWLAAKPLAPRGWVWAVVAVNAAWAVESVLLLLLGWVTPTVLGGAFMLGQAAFVALLAELQVMALRGGRGAALARA